MDDQTFKYGVYQRLSENTYAKSIAVKFSGNGGTPGEDEKTSFIEFLGWALSEFGEKAYADKENVKDITTGPQVELYAKWGAPKTITLPTAAKTGYTFNKWHTKPDGTGTEVGGAGDPYTPPRNPPQDEVTLYAHWEVRNFTVTFDPTSGTVSQTSKTVTYDSPYGNLPVPTSDEYAFTGWFTNANGGTEVTSQTMVTVAQDHTIYAHWQDGKMTLTFDPNDGMLPEEVEPTRRYWIGQTFGELPVPTRTGNTFLGWFDDLESQTPQEITSETIAPDHDMTIYASWLPYNYTIRYNANGGTGSMDDQTMTYGVRNTLSPLGFSIPGSVFLGWATSPSGEPQYSDQETVVNLTSTSQGIVDLYAQWDAQTP